MKKEERIKWLREIAQNSNKSTPNPLYRAGSRIIFKEEQASNFPEASLEDKTQFLLANPKFAINTISSLYRLPVTLLEAYNVSFPYFRAT